MPEEITDPTTMALLDKPLSRDDRLAIVAAQCASELMSEIAVKEHGKPEWPRQIADAQEVIAKRIYCFLLNKVKCEPPA